MRAKDLVKRWTLVPLYVVVCMLHLPALASGPAGDMNGWTYGGHIKYQYRYTEIPKDSVIQRYGGDKLQDHYLEGRLKLSARRDRWDFRTHVQVISAHSDTLGGSRNLPSLPLTGSGVINDDRRWFNLTHELRDENKDATVVRLDRASIGYTGDKLVVRFGRHAVSWGNGLLFTPMDIFNPFDPTAVDKEYKTGDDMLYGQYLRNNGDDMQLVGVVRRDPSSGNVEQDESSLAVKYHGFLGRSEYDVLLAEHYGQKVLGLGFSTDLGGAIWRADLLWNDTREGAVISGVAGVSYSGAMAGHFWTGLLEYYYNGFGQSEGVYSLEGIVRDRELVNRLGRGELFNIGRHYLGASVMFEVTPLFKITPNIFLNIVDPSVYTQLVFSYNWKQDIELLGALNAPFGDKGTEYGGIYAPQTGWFFSTGPSVSVQLAWYF